MKQILTLSLLILSISCTTTTREASSSSSSSSELSIALTPTFEPAASRATSSAFEEGDQIGLYAAIVGQELTAAGNHTDNAQFTAAADGAFSSEQTLYYPEAKSAIMLCAYYPYNSSVVDATKIPFAVTDDLKASDLCYAQREALPSKEAQTLQFKHLLSRVVVNVNFDDEPKVKSVTAVKFINTATDFTVDLNTGAITLGEQGETLATNQLSANQYEAIVAPQTFAARQAMLKIEVLDQSDAPQSYYYAPFEALTLTEAALNTLNIVLNDHNIATMKGSPQIADWTATAKSDIARKDVSNRFTAHWLIAEPQFASVNKIMLTVKDSLRNSTTKLTADNVKLVAGSSLAAASYTFDFAPSGLDYPYTIQSVEFYNGMTLISSVIPNISTVAYKTGAMTFGVDRKAVLTLSSYSASVDAQATAAYFTMSSNAPYTSSFSSGAWSNEASGSAPPYTNRGVGLLFPAQGAVATVAKTHTMTITPAVDYLIGSQRRTFTVTQAAVPCTFALSPATAYVDAQTTYTPFTLSSNAPYTSSYSSGSWSYQSVGNTPPYTNEVVYINFPAQGTAPAPARTHTMTITQSADAALSPKSGTFTAYQAAVPNTFAFSSYSGNVDAQATAAYFTMSSNAPYTSSFSSGAWSNEASGSAPPYTNRGVGLLFPAQGAVATVAKAHSMAINQSADTYDRRSATYTAYQNAVPCTFSLSATSANVDAQATSAAFTLSSNAPYTSTFTSGASSPQASGSAPPYTNRGITLNFPAQGYGVMAARSHVMTIRQSADASLSPKSATYTVNQAGVLPYLNISATSPGVTIPKGGASYALIIYSNTTWSASGTNATMSSGSGNVHAGVVVPASPAGSGARAVSVTITTTTNAGHASISRTWSGTQEAAIDYYPTPVPGYPQYYVALVDDVKANGYDAYMNCRAKGFQLPVTEVLKAICNNKASYGLPSTGSYWSGTSYTSGEGGENEYERRTYINLGSCTSGSNNEMYDIRGVRCVKYIK